MPVESLRGGNNGVAYLLSAEVVFAIIAAFCSSPQTTEINADTRAETLMKWVSLGTVTSAAFVIPAAYLSPDHAPAILLGGGVAAATMYGSYIYAKRCGLANPGPSTES